MQRIVKNNHLNINFTLKSIKGFQVFDTIYKNSIRVHSPNLTLAYLKPKKVVDLNLLPTKETIQNFDVDDKLTQYNITIYFGATIGKKNTKKAVSRNRIKRLIRESLAIYCTNYNTETNTLPNRLNNAFIVISARFKLLNPKSLTLNDIQPEINQLLDRIINHK